MYEKLVPRDARLFIDKSRAKSKSDFNFFAKITLTILAALGVVYILYKYLSPDYNDAIYEVEEDIEE